MPATIRILYESEAAEALLNSAMAAVSTTSLRHWQREKADPGMRGLFARVFGNQGMRPGASGERRWSPYSSKYRKSGRVDLIETGEMLDAVANTPGEVKEIAGRDAIISWGGNIGVPYFKWHQAGSPGGLIPKRQMIYLLDSDLTWLVPSLELWIGEKIVRKTQ